MKVLHVISSLSRESGGPSRSAQGLVAGLNRAGVEAWLMTLRRGDEPWVGDVGHFVNGEPFQDAVGRIRPDIVHIHGIWSLGLHRCAVICRRRQIPYVIAPRGMLEPWSLQQKRLKKRMARWLYQDDDLKNAAALHATAESEAGQFRRLGFANKVIVSPNGVNLPENFNSAGHAGEDKRILFVGRMHPKKGVLELVEALSRCFNGSKGLDDWKAELVYTVNGEEEHEYESTIKRRVEELGLADRFIYTGALGDDEKWAAYTRADLFALPTYSENFGIVVAEALWAGVPVVTTKGTPWSELADRKCGWWIDAGVGPLTEALSGAMALTDAERREMGLRGRSLIEEKYTWEAVVKRLVAGYESIVI